MKWENWKQDLITMAATLAGSGAVIVLFLLSDDVSGVVKI